MKAIIWTRYGPPDSLQFGEVEKPVPREHEVLIKVHASTVTAGDCEMRSLKFPIFLSLPIRVYVGFTKPKRITIPGMELSGEVEAVGTAVTRFKAGDQVFGTAGFKMGAYAEYVCLPGAFEEGALAAKPVNMTFEEAAAVPTGGLEALHFLGKGKVQPGEKVLINGAGGSIGTFGIQLAKYYGAEVTAVDSLAKLDMMRSIGADHVIDYTREDFTQKGVAYDVIFDVIGKSPFSRSLKSLNRGGRYLLANPGLKHMLRGSLASKRSGKQVIFGTANPTAEDLDTLKALIEAGALKTVIDRRYPLAQTADAHRYVESGQKKGNVVITVSHNSAS